MLQNLQGVVPIVAVPFTKSNEVDYDSLASLIQHLAGIGCHGLTMFGIASEYYKLTDAESNRIAQVMVAECRKANVPSILSVTQHATHAAIEWARHLESQGADCLMLLPPFFLKPSASDLYDHMKAVCKSVKIPVMIQYAPEQTGVGMAPSLLYRLHKEVENAIYFKIECKPAGPYITDFLALAGTSAKVFAGNAGFQMIETFDRGAVGSMPGPSLAELYLRIYHALLAGQHTQAVALHNALLPLLNHIRQNVEMIIHFEKRILAMRGIIATDVCRSPGFTSDPRMDALFTMYYDEVKDLLVAPPR